ncbi:GroES-like protein [Annulohypoxylon truncatum]|uniref:GroES-like protein n=1 Tax=Annulohypoxylon truncatum TaxID=327061 RepID=UPI0020075823|nr:GroES-like protein [Annulohypoxylon truncatum]KAI1204931.1 GroES-like protein [Annulohypoxylon truncatum]
MSNPTNRAFWQDAAGVPSAIRESPVPSSLGPHEVLIKARAWAVNPVDAYLQVVALPFITYPAILGTDVAGVVEAVGSGPASQKFRVGDRVLGYAPGRKREGAAFQEHVVLDQGLAMKIPDTMAFREACVFPLCLATAGGALFGSEYLGLPFPGEGKGEGKTLLVWGGAAGVGSNAIQLAKAAGFDVVATCSAHNFELVKGLGAGKVFDYKSPSVIDDVVAELDKRVCAGIFQAAGPQNGVVPCLEIAWRSKQDLFVACANLVPEGSVPQGVRATFVLDTSDERGSYYGTTSKIFADFLPRALERGEYKVAPTPEVVKTKGLEGIQEAIDLLKQGVSAKKIVVEAE